MIPQLTPAELSLVSDPDVLLTKNKIIGYVYDLFGELADEYKRQLSSSQLVINSPNAKISKGENYNGLPYVILDYPRVFSRQHVFAIRSFFWWGHFFSITLHLAGKYLLDYTDAMQAGLTNHLFQGWYINASDEQWEHHFQSSNYREVETGEKLDAQLQPFLKLSRKIPLSEWDNTFAFFSNNFNLLISILGNQAPIR